MQNLFPGFQVTVNSQPAPGIAGDFYGANPRAVVLAGPGNLVAPVGGLVVGQFAWADLTTEVVSQSFNPNGQLGFLRRSDAAIIVTYLGISTFVLNAGFPVTLFSQGDFWGLFAGGASPGQIVYADPSTGALVAGGASAPLVTSFTASVGAAVTGVVGVSAATATSTLASAALTAVTGYVSPGDVLTDGTNSATVLNQASGTTGGAGTYNLVAAPTPGAWTGASLTGTSTNVDLTAVTGLVSVGDTITGAGYAAATITGQLMGVAGSTGLYSTNAGQHAHLTSQAFTVTSNVLDVTAVASGVVDAGDVLTATGFTAATVTGQLAGTPPGGVGTYSISGSPQHTASTATFGAAAIATPWKVKSKAGNGEVAKISTWGK